MRPPSRTNLDAPRSLADLLPRSISRTSPQAQCFQYPKYFTVGGFRAQTQYWYPSITWRSAEAGDLRMLAEYAQRFCHLRQNVRRLQQLIALVRCTHHRPQAGLPSRDRRITHGRRKNTGFKKLPGKFEGFGRIANVDRHNRRLTALELKPALLQFFFEKFCIGPELFHQLFAFGRIEQSERRLAGRHGGGRVGGGKQEGPRAQIQKVDQVA